MRFFTGLVLGLIGPLFYESQIILLQIPDKAEYRCLNLHYVSTLPSWVIVVIKTYIYEQITEMDHLASSKQTMHRLFFLA